MRPISGATVARDDWRNGSLYKGDAALALLEADIERPEDARMPLFEPEA